MTIVNVLVTALIALLFVAVAAALVRGVGVSRRPVPAETEPAGRHVDIRIEAGWTACAAVLLFVVFVMVR
jgi:heme/copper-type cytochrome/quinol oxidase subunit 2